MKGKLLAKANVLESGIMLLMEQELGLPFLPKFATIEEYKNLKKVTSNVEKKILLKFLKSASSFSDYSDEKCVLIGKLESLLKVGKDKSSNILDIARKYTDELHMFEQNLPHINVGSYTGEEMYKFFISISKYDSASFFKIISKVNYKKIRTMVANKVSKKKILLQVDRYNVGISSSMATRMNRAILGDNWREKLANKDASMEILKNTTKISNMKSKNLSFIKNKLLGDFWGKETLCCLKIGGAAGGLLDRVERCPLSGEIVGTVAKSKIMSFVWDMVEIVDGVANKTLVLDNIESNNCLSAIETNEFLKEVKRISKDYKTIYCGTIRNDCTFEKEITDTKKPRQSKLVGLIELEKFECADSKELYTIGENSSDKNFKVRKMDHTSLFQAKYLEQHIYPGCDEQFLVNIKLDTPCYVIDSNTTLGGYFVSRYKYFKKGTKVFDQKKEIKRVDFEEGKDIKKLYIEDLVIAPNKKLKYSLKYIIEDFIKFCKTNSIDSVMLNSNDNSEALVKRLTDNGIRVEEEELETIYPENELKFIDVESLENLI